VAATGKFWRVRSIAEDQNALDAKVERMRDVAVRSVRLQPDRVEAVSALLSRSAREEFSTSRRNLLILVCFDDGRIVAPRLRMNADIKDEFGAVRADLREVDTRLSTEIRRVESTLSQEIREDGAATRRHFDIVSESLRDDIRIIAEGLIALDAKVERMRESG
jgi:hypothetical protein